MKVLICGFLIILATPLLAERETVNLGNEPWPPYVLSGEQKGTAEQIVCEALNRAGWDCDIQHGDWEETLQRASNGQLDGIAALWQTPEREATLRYSRPYLTNRLVPVIADRLDMDIKTVDDLYGLRVVTEIEVAYGDEIMAVLERLNVQKVRGVENALIAVQDNKADVALVDELSARDFLSQTGEDTLNIGQRALAFRELYFAVSKKHPRNAEIVASFNVAYQSMLKDGTVNRILDIDWVVTDLKFDGVPDFIHRDGGNTLEAGSSSKVYPLGQQDYQMISEPGFSSSNANFQIDKLESGSTADATSDSFALKKKCYYDNHSARIICPTK